MFSLSFAQTRASSTSTEEKLKSLQRPRWEVADIFRRHGDSYRQAHPLPLSHLRVMHAIEVCRTDYLGGHIEKCDDCGYERQAYNSCRNRHCPKCQALGKAKWLEERKAELLPLRYFHIIFTLPHQLNDLILHNKRVLLNILFKAVSQTLLAFGKNNLGGKVGFTTILHTWNQKLLDHFHIHCLIPGGALSFDGQGWINLKKENFLFSVEALSVVFRGKYIDDLKKAYQKGELKFPPQSGGSSTAKAANRPSKKEFQQLIDQLYQKKWVVYSKASFQAPQIQANKMNQSDSTQPDSEPDREDLLDYLARYTHRVAISNERIQSVEDGQVTFRYKDRKKNNQQQTITLEANEFIRRFLLHILPDGFMRIRHYGFLANRYKKKSLALCRKALGLSGNITQPQKKSTREMMRLLTGKDITRCPNCSIGTLRVAEKIPPLYAQYQPKIKYRDTS
jgi:predicted Zn-ribbon and HTH transcriptional regulator